MKLIEETTANNVFARAVLEEKVDAIVARADVESLRTKLREEVKLANEVIAGFWPMRTFVHHNPLHSLEYLKFDEAVQRGKQFLNGKGYLPNYMYREYFKSGRIQPRHVDSALEAKVQNEHISIGTRQIGHKEVLYACLTNRISAFADEYPSVSNVNDPDYELIKSLSDRLASVLPVQDASEKLQAVASEDEAALARTVTLSQWCDQVLDTQIVDQITSDLIGRCEPFLDEGYTTWEMPGREKGFFRSWKATLSDEWATCGIDDVGRKVDQLPDDAEYVVIDCLQALAIPQQAWRDYITLHMSALPGWVGYIKWRAKQNNYVWQEAYPIDLFQYLAVSLWYERELVNKYCHQFLGIDGRYPEMISYMKNSSREYFLRRERIAGRLPAAYSAEVDRLSHRKGVTWDDLFNHYWDNANPKIVRASHNKLSKSLCLLASEMKIEPADLLNCSSTDLKKLIDWIKAFPESDHGPVWLRAFEAGYQEQLLGRIAEAKVKNEELAHSKTQVSERPHTQSVYCIDVRSEPFRRHLESLGPNQTYGFAGFFGVLIRHSFWEHEHKTEQYPVIVGPKTEVHEIPRSYLEKMLPMYEHRTSMIHAGHTLLHDLKHNAITTYVMVEAVGLFYTIQMFGKTILPRLYNKASHWLQKKLIPAISTTITVDKPSEAETEEMLKVKYENLIFKVLHDVTGLSRWQIPTHLVDALWQHILNSEAELTSSLIEIAGEAGISKDKLSETISRLQLQYGVEHKEISCQKESILHTGFSLDEQAQTVSTALRIMGLTSNFARLVLICGHGSESDNNPYESALDCGACGGNEGKPNARVFVMMANNPLVRERLAQNGIEIPADTYFVAGQINTTTDEVELFDLEDFPLSHSQDIARLIEYLEEAGRRTSQERCSRFADIENTLSYDEAKSHVIQRSADWSQVRPEWGLSSNTAFVIGRRALTDSLDLRGRVFLHSYDYRYDTESKFLEVLLTAPQVVAQWINMEHYFSTTDYDVYGSGSKIYHNVVGNFGVLAGPWSDLRLGLSWQTVMNGEMPFHEPMRLVSVVEAPRKEIEKLIAKHELLRHYYHNEWVNLVVMEPEEGVLYRYRPTGEWVRISNATSNQLH
nr:DUF2309 domain-containing protein [Nitrosomonas nitrosa]